MTTNPGGTLPPPAGPAGTSARIRGVDARPGDDGSPAGPALVIEVGHVGLTVTDLDEALSMWCDDLGFVLERTFTLDEATTAGTTGVRSATIDAATVVLGPHRLELLQYRPAPAGVARALPSQSGATHIALVVADLAGVLLVCRRHGWVPVGGPHRLTSGARAGTVIVYLDGPAGGTLELIAPPRDEPSAGAGAGSEVSVPVERRAAGDYSLPADADPVDHAGEQPAPARGGLRRNRVGGA
ncbi:hypothetical protein GCM10027047_27040 [Rhodococcus aerolatus]